MGLVYSTYLLGPGSLAFLAWTYSHRHAEKLSLWVFVYAHAEAIFFIYFLQRLVRWQRPAQWKPLPTREERRKLFAKVADTVKCPKKWAASWHPGVPEDEITTGDVDDLIYMMLNFYGNDPDAEGRREVAQLRRDLFSKSDLGRLPDEPAKHEGKRMAFMRDTLVAWAPGLPMYALASILQLAFSASYLGRGYRRHRGGGLVYWYKPGADGTSKPPMVFFPGVGVGSLMYDMLLRLVEEREPDRAVFVVQIPGVSMAASNWLPGHAHPPDHAQVAFAFEEMLRNHLCEGALLVGHSYGSVYASYALRQCRALVKGLVLVEPAAMLCTDAKNTRSFLYSVGPDGWKSALSVLFRLEPFVSLTLRRHFDATHIILHMQDFGDIPAAVLVSMGDTIMPSDAVLAHAAKHPRPHVIVEAFEGRPCEHGTWCHDMPMNKRVLRAIQEVSKHAEAAKEKKLRTNARQLRKVLK